MRRALATVEEASDAAQSVTLDLEERRKRRHVVTTSDGETILIDLAEAPRLRQGQGLVLDDGTVIRVEARPEQLYVIRAPDLVRIAWHLGNRHLATEISGDTLRIRPDHVIRAMLEGLGAEVYLIEAVFEPESGAYGQHGHHHHHD